MINLLCLMMLIVNSLILISWVYRRTHLTRRNYPLGLSAFAMTTSGCTIYLGTQSSELADRYGSHPILELCELICHNDNLLLIGHFVAVLSGSLYLACLVLLALDALSAKLSINLTDKIQVITTGLSVITICFFILNI